MESHLRMKQSSHNSSKQRPESNFEFGLHSEVLSMHGLCFANWEIDRCVSELTAQTQVCNKDVVTKGMKDRFSSPYTSPLPLCYHRLFRK